MKIKNKPNAFTKSGIAYKIVLTKVSIPLNFFANFIILNILNNFIIPKISNYICI